MNTQEEFLFLKPKAWEKICKQKKEMVGESKKQVAKISYSKQDIASRYQKWERVRKREGEHDRAQRKAYLKEKNNVRKTQNYKTRPRHGAW